MNILLIILGTVLTILFFLNIKSAADILCRIVGGFVLLFIYNYVSGMLPFHPVGINLLSSLTVGILGIPGALLLFCASLFL